jgi:hypothetical protein
MTALAQSTEYEKENRDSPFTGPITGPETPAAETAPETETIYRILFCALKVTLSLKKYSVMGNHHHNFFPDRSHSSDRCTRTFCIIVLLIITLSSILLILLGILCLADSKLGCAGKCLM